MTQRDGGKGDQPRPIGVPKEQFEANWDKIFKNGIPTLEELEKQREAKKNPLADKLVKQIEENLREHHYITPED